MELLNKSLEDGRHLMEEISTDMASIKKVDCIEVSKSKVQMTPSRCRFFSFQPAHSVWECKNKSFEK